MRVVVGILGVVGCGGSNDLVLVDANNYAYHGEIDLRRVEVATQTDLDIRWDELTTDIRGRPLDPTTVQQVAILEVREPFEDAITLIEKDELRSTQDARLYDNPGGTSARISEFSAVSNAFEIALLIENPASTWLLSLLNVEDGLTDLLMSTVIVPTEGVSATEVAFTDDSASLEVEVDLHTAEPVVARAGDGPFTLDWTGLENDVFGHAFDPIRGDQLMVARYASTDVADIEAAFLDLDGQAEELYRADAYGVTGVDLSLAADADGRAFPGFTKDGTWLVAILCTTCTTPVPLVLSIVDVE
jgi:hypothetical protein